MAAEAMAGGEVVPAGFIATDTGRAAPPIKRFGVWLAEEGSADPIGRAWGEHLASALELTGVVGKEAACQVRLGLDESSGLDLWTPWIGNARAVVSYAPDRAEVDDDDDGTALVVGVRHGPLLWAVTMARALWQDTVRDELKRRRRNRPAVVRGVVIDRLVPMMTGQMALPGTPGDDVVCDARGRPVARIELGGAPRALVERGIALFGSVHGHRLVRSLVLRAHDQWIGNPDGRHDLVEFDGGLQGLGRAIGFRSKTTKRLEALAAAGSALHFMTPGAYHGGLWTYSITRGSHHGGPGRVSFKLAEALCPGYVHTLAKGGAQRRLVPELRHAPPVSGVGRPNEQGAVWTMHRLMLVDLVDQAESMLQRGGAHIGPDRWIQLARQSMLPVRCVDAVIDTWLHGDDDAPSLLERRNGLWTLADEHAPERAFIEAGGEARIRGRAGGLRRGGKGSRRRGKTPSG